MLNPFEERREEMRVAVLAAVKTALEKDPPRYLKDTDGLAHQNGCRFGFVSNFGKPILFHLEFNKTNHRLPGSVYDNLEGLSAEEITDKIMSDKYSDHGRLPKESDLKEAIKPRRGRPTNAATGPQSSAERSAAYRHAKKVQQENIDDFFARFARVIQDGTMRDETKIAIMKDAAGVLENTKYGHLFRPAPEKPAQTDIEDFVDNK